jgi:NADPH:quinone reductase-like Zn-dependent oxidoreductase
MPSAARQGGTVGLEFSGIITRVGASVTNVSVGDSVFGCGRECCGSHTVVSKVFFFFFFFTLFVPFKHFVAPSPPNVSLDRLGGIGLEIATAYHSLVNVARVKRGEYVLVHQATGGVGLCAVYLCNHLGAVPICTAGTSFKRRFLRLMGVHHVFDSRNTKYCSEV